MMQEIDELVGELDRPSGRCLFLHDWSKWTEPEEVPQDGFIKALGLNVVMKSQSRYCLRCHKAELRIISLSK